MPNLANLNHPGETLAQQHQVIRTFLAAMWSEIASLELEAAKVIQQRRDGVLEFPWRKDHPWTGADRRRGNRLH